MEASHTVPQIEKRLYENKTGGWLGVVVLDHNGKEMGETIEPHGTIWLSDAEAILTARAPKDPKDNPFEEQTFYGLDGNGAKKAFQMRPLVLVSDDSRFVPSMERYVPILAELKEDNAEGRARASAAAHDGGPITEAAAARSAEIIKEAGDAQPAVAAPAPVAPVEEPQPASEVQTTTAPSPEPTATPGELEGETPTGDDVPQSWSEPSASAGTVQPGALQGSDEPGPDPAADTPPPEATSAPMPPQAVATAPGGDPSRQPPEASPEEHAAKGAAEEHAAAVDPEIGEETGQAKPPTGDAPEGEYAQAEEIGSPDAPAAEAPAGE